METKINSLKLYKDCITELRKQLPYSHSEINQLVFMMMEFCLGLKKTDILAGKEVVYSLASQSSIMQFMERLSTHEPIQYIIGEAYFFGRKYKVNPAVLIPRNETEELCALVIQDFKNQKGLNILDICTGSACIAITMDKELVDCHISALDISPSALEVAAENASLNQSKCIFYEYDILGKQAFPAKDFDIIISNPPYITEAEKEKMLANVLDHEPSIALFVPNEDPLLFYRAILSFAALYLKAKGHLYFEINEQFGSPLIALAGEMGFGESKILQDMHGRNRFLSAQKIN